MKKKKGFTLIELIAVIAILAILGAVLVPKILGYRRNAEASNLKTGASEILNSIRTYNADNTGSSKISETDSVSTAITRVNSDAATNVYKTSSNEYAKLKNLSVSQLINVADGNFTLDASGNVNAGSTGVLD